MPLDSADWQECHPNLNPARGGFSHPTGEVSAAWPRTADEPGHPDETTALLIRARGFLERGWCKGTMAQTALGEHVEPRSSAAVRWCSWGALLAAGMASPDYQAVARLDGVTSGTGGIVLFNDAQKTVEPVLAAFDRAIAAGAR